MDTLDRPFTFDDAVAQEKLENERTGDKMLYELRVIIEKCKADSDVHKDCVDFVKHWDCEKDGDIPHEYYTTSGLLFILAGYVQTLAEGEAIGEDFLRNYFHCVEEVKSRTTSWM